MNAIAHLGLGRRNGDMATLPFIPKRNNSTRNYVKQLAVEKIKDKKIKNQTDKRNGNNRRR